MHPLSRVRGDVGPELLQCRQEPLELAEGPHVQAEAQVLGPVHGGGGRGHGGGARRGRGAPCWGGGVRRVRPVHS